MDPAVIREAAHAERSVERLIKLYAKNAPVEELVEEAKRFMEIGRGDLTEKLGDAAKLAAMARAVEVISRPVEPVQDLAKLVALGLD